MTAPTDLAKRLREDAKERMTFSQTATPALCREAADALDRLAEELAEARRILGENDTLLASGCNAAQPDAIRALAAERDAAMATARGTAATIADWAKAVDAAQFLASRETESFVAARAERDRCAAVLLQREAEIDELDREVGEQTRRCESAEQAYTVGQGLLVEWRERASAAEAKARALAAELAEERRVQTWTEAQRCATANLLAALDAEPQRLDRERLQAIRHILSRLEADRGK